MRTKRELIARRALLSIVVPLLLLSAAALAGLNGVDVRISNQGTEAVVVTVVDTSTEPHSVVLAHQRVNGFATVPISLAMDPAGRGNLSWTAVTADPTDRKCGHENQSGLTDSVLVQVHADSKCGGA
jgi:hypothetical protein